VGVKGIVELRGQGLHFGESCPRDLHEVVVLIMIAHVETKFVQGPVIRIGLLGRVFGTFGRDEVVLLDPAGPQGMKAQAEKGGEKKIQEGSPSRPEKTEAKKTHLHQKVQKDPSVEKSHLFQTSRPGQALDQAEEDEKKGFAKGRIADKTGLVHACQIRIKVELGLMGVVEHMIFGEGHGAGEKLWKIGEDGQEAVGRRGLENEIVGAFVDDDEEGVVGYGPH